MTATTGLMILTSHDDLHFDVFSALLARWRSGSGPMFAQWSSYCEAGLLAKPLVSTMLVAPAGRAISAATPPMQPIPGMFRADHGAAYPGASALHKPC